MGLTNIFEQDLSDDQQKEVNHFLEGSGSGKEMMPPHPPIQKVYRKRFDKEKQEMVTIEWTPSTKCSRLNLETGKYTNTPLADDYFKEYYHKHKMKVVCDNCCNMVYKQKL